MRAKGLNIKGGFPGSEGLCKVSGHTVIETSTWWYYVVWGGGEEALGMEMIQMGERAGGWWETEYRQEKIHRSEFTKILPPPRELLLLDTNRYLIMRTHMHEASVKIEFSTLRRIHLISSPPRLPPHPPPLICNLRAGQPCADHKLLLAFCPRTGGNLYCYSP